MLLNLEEGGELYAWLVQRNAYSDAMKLLETYNQGIHKGKTKDQRSEITSAPRFSGRVRDASGAAASNR